MYQNKKHNLYWAQTPKERKYVKLKTLREGVKAKKNEKYKKRERERDT